MNGTISGEAASHIEAWYRAAGIDQPEKQKKPKKASKAVKAKTTNWKTTRRKAK